MFSYPPTFFLQRATKKRERAARRNCGYVGYVHDAIIPTRYNSSHDAAQGKGDDNDEVSAHEGRYATKKTACVIALWLGYRLADGTPPALSLSRDCIFSLGDRRRRDDRFCRFLKRACTFIFIFSGSIRPHRLYNHGICYERISLSSVFRTQNSGFDAHHDRF